MVATKDSKEQIFKAFEQILNQRKAIDSKIATKEEEAEKQKNKQVLELASTYTVDSIVKGLADLQLEFGTIINQLSDKLTTELAKRDELKLAIEVENQQLQYLKQIRVVADALHILTQEHQENLKQLEQTTAEQREQIQTEQADKRKSWLKEQAEFEQQLQEETESLAKLRQQQESDYAYEIERQRKMEADDYEGLKRNQEREHREANQEKEKHWAEREKIMQERQPLLKEYQQKINGFPKDLEESVKKAREEAIKDVHQESKIKSDLLEKEWESTKQNYEFKVKSLEETIQKQLEQINQLYAQLQDSLKQSQSLAMRAFDSSAKTTAQTKS